MLTIININEILGKVVMRLVSRSVFFFTFLVIMRASNAACAEPDRPYPQHTPYA